MKTAFLLAVVALALSVSAGNNESIRRNGLFRGGNNNNNNGGFGFGNKGNKGNNGAKAKVGGTTSSTSSASAASQSASTATGGASNSTSNAGSAAGNNDSNPQTSLTLNPQVIASGFANNGQGVPTAGQVASLTSTNNFINFCLTVPNLPITNGKQITTGSCNPAPMGVIASNQNMPSAKFVFPANGDTSIQENAPFTIKMAIQNLATGNFVNADQNFFAAPQQVNGQGDVIGHSHVVVESLSSLDQTTPTNPLKFVFFKGLNAAAVGGVLTADVTSGLPAGFYKLSSINTAANHQPVLVAVAQHGSLDDAVYFTVQPSGAAAAAAAPASANSTQPAAPPAAPSAAAPAAAPAKAGKRFYSRALN